MASGLFATKSVDALRADAAGEHGLWKRALGSMDLVLLGIGAINRHRHLRADGKGRRRQRRSGRGAVVHRGRIASGFAGSLAAPRWPP